eukprot:scaffold184751_cov18-Tisochrysis_lutea.AAC.1
MWNRVLTPCTGATGQQLHCSTQSIGELAAVKLGLKTLRVESSNWDGRLALVVASDASVYEPGSAARATGMEQSNRVSLQNAGVLVGSKYQLSKHVLYGSHRCRLEFSSPIKLKQSWS